MPRLRANWAQRVPALALGAAVLPHRSPGPARLASMRPVERVPELQGAAIFLKGLAGLPAPLEDGAEERVDAGRAPRRGRDRLAPARPPLGRARSCGSAGPLADMPARAGRGAAAPGTPRRRAPKRALLRGGLPSARRRRPARAPPEGRDGRP